MIARIGLLFGLVILLLFGCDSELKKDISLEDSGKSRKDSIRKVIADSLAKKRAAYAEKYKPMTRLDSLFHQEIAKEKPDYKRLDSLLEAGGNINSINKYTVTVKKNGANIPVIKDFMRNKYKEVSIEETPLLHKCIRVDRGRLDLGAFKLIKYLLEKGADPHLTTQISKSIKWQNYHPMPLDVIIRSNSFHYGHFETISTIKKYVALFKVNGFKMDTLNLLCTDGNWELIQSLVKEGAAKKIDIGLGIGQHVPSPGWRITLRDHFEELKTFELDFSNLDTDQMLFFGKTELLEKLLDLGLSANHLSAKRKIPLLFSTIDNRDGNIELFKLLVEKYKANTSIRYKGETVLSFAEKNGQMDIVEYLKKRN